MKKERKQTSWRLRRPLGVQLYRNEKKSVLAVYLVLRLLVIAALVLSAIGGAWDNVFVCLLVLVLFLLPVLLEKKLEIELPSALQIIIILHIFAAEILGELSSFFVRFRYWDTLLHTVWGFLCAAIGFALVDVLNSSKKIRMSLSPAYLAVAAFCFSMTIGVIWEFFEFGMDQLFHLDMQKDTVIHAFASVTLDPTLQNIPIRVEDISEVAVNGKSLGLGGYLDVGLYDTMKDLFVNFIGAAVFAVIGYFDAKSKGRLKFVHNFIPTTAEASASEQETASV